LLRQCLSAIWQKGTSRTYPGDITPEDENKQTKTHHSQDGWSRWNREPNGVCDLGTQKCYKATFIDGEPYLRGWGWTCGPGPDKCLKHGHPCITRWPPIGFSLCGGFGDEEDETELGYKHIKTPEKNETYQK